jgi:hypothetical protein
LQKKLRSTLFWFILLQPFIEIYWLYNGPIANLLPFTIPTILRIIGVFIVFLMYFSEKRNWLKLRKSWWIIAYVIILIAYSLVHLYLAKDFKALDPTSYGYSTFGEIFYLIRMALPLVILYITQNADFSEDQFIHVIQGLVGSISGIIVVSDIFKISLTSYGRTQLIKYNIFEWFFHSKASFYQMAAKGWFNFANTTSAVLFMLMPLMLYVLVKQFNWINILLTSLQALAMLMLGTKVALYGLIVSLVAFVIICLIHRFILKNLVFSKKLILTFVLLVVGIGLIAPYTPAMRRTSFDDAIVKTRKKRTHKKSLNKKLEQGLEKSKSKSQKKKFLKKFIPKHYQDYSLQHRFIYDSYNYKYDPYFWLAVMKLPVAERLDNRQIETRMLDQVKKNNNNKLADWFGISYVRESNIFPLERDFISQYYSLGIIGTILFLGIYVVCLLYAIVKWFSRKENRTFQHTMLITSLGFIMLAAFYSGNVMDFLFATIIMSFIMGYLLSIIDKQKHQEKTKLSFN